MKVLTNAKIKSLTNDAFASGFANGYNFGVTEGQSKLKEFKVKETPVIIENIMLKSLTVRPYLYTIRFRSQKNGAVTEINLEFDTQNFSMSDIRKKINEEFFGYGATNETENGM